MWTSERNRNLPVREAAAEVGTVTLGGDPAGVSVGGERRWINVYGPGGYSWRPTSGDKVMVLKAGAEGESPCILGTTQDAEDLEPGEIRLSGVDCSLLLGRRQVEMTSGEGSLRLDRKGLELDGGLELNGGLNIGGQPLEEIVRSIAREVASQMLSERGGS